MAEKKNIYTIYDDNKNGTVVISDHVLCTIAGIAAMEVEGVASLKGEIDKNEITKSAMYQISRCARIFSNDDGSVFFKLVLNIKYGYNLPETMKKVQERVKDTIESMSGLRVDSVNISISDVKIDKQLKTRKIRKAIEEEEK